MQDCVFSVLFFKYHEAPKEDRLLPMLPLQFCVMLFALSLQTLKNVTEVYVGLWGLISVLQT